MEILDGFTAVKPFVVSRWLIEFTLYLNNSKIKNNYFMATKLEFNPKGIKPLDWQYLDERTYIAYTPFGCYRIISHEGKFKLRFPYSNEEAFEVLKEEIFDNSCDAKSFAQIDFTQSVMGCLTFENK